MQVRMLYSFGLPLDYLLGKVSWNATSLTKTPAVCLASMPRHRPTELFSLVPLSPYARIIGCVDLSIVMKSNGISTSAMLAGQFVLEAPCEKCAFGHE